MKRNRRGTSVMNPNTNAGVTPGVIPNSGTGGTQNFDSRNIYLHLTVS